jgi:putative addiction module component (TIGR02574 family)
MDMAAVLREVNHWPIEERLRLVEAIWDRMIESGADPELTESQRKELDRRLEALDFNPDDVIPWESVQEFVRRPR